MGKVQHYIKEIIAFFLTFGLIYVLKDAGIMKYVVLLAASFVLLLYGLKNFERDFLLFFLPSAIYIGFGLLIALAKGNFTFQSIKETAFAVVPLVAAISFFVASKRANIELLKWQYWSMVLLTLYCLRYYYIEDVTETQYAFVFGVFLLYFCIIKKNVKYTLFTTFMLYLMNKRITMLAAVLILVLYDLTLYIVKKKPEWKKKIPQCLSIAAAVLFCGYVIFLCVGNLEGQFIQDLTSGRSSAWAAVKNYYQLSVFWFGRGLGDVVNLLGELQFPSFTTNLHNDLLKVFAEIGLVGYILWIASHFGMCCWISRKRNLGYKKTIFLNLVMIYSLLNYMTDNIMVYVNYWFPAYLILLMVVFSDDDAGTEEIENKKEHWLLLGVILSFGICILADVVHVYIDYKNPSKFTIPHDAVEIYSPDGGTTRASIWLRDGQPYYRVRYGGADLIEPSILGIETSEYAIEKEVVFEEIIYQNIVEEKDAIENAENPLKASYQPVIITMQKNGHVVEMETRVYDYGVAFRYILPLGVEGLDELTQIRFLQGSKLDIYDENLQSDVAGVSTEELEKTVYRLPFTVNYENGTVLAISEVQGVQQMLSYVTKAKKKERTLDVEFYSEMKCKGKEKIKTPWRVFEIVR